MSANGDEPVRYWLRPKKGKWRLVDRDEYLKFEQAWSGISAGSIFGAEKGRGRVTWGEIDEERCGDEEFLTAAREAGATKRVEAEGEAQPR